MAAPLRRCSWQIIRVLAALACVVFVRAGAAEDPTAIQESPSVASDHPPLPASSLPAVETADDPDSLPPPDRDESNRDESLEARLKQMEEENRRLGNALESTLKQYGQQMDRLQREIADLKSQVGTNAGGSGRDGAASRRPAWEP